MPKLIIDIETIGDDFDALDEITQENLTRWIKKSSTNEDEYREELTELKNNLGFSPLTGQIVAIGVLDHEKDKGVVYFQAPGEKISEFAEGNFVFKPMTEKEMLQNFWQGARDYTEFITFNGRQFDIPFLFIRSAIYNIKPNKDLMRGRYLYQQAANAQNIDLLDQLTFYGAMRGLRSLHLWCHAFGIESPKAGGVTGDDVAQLFKEKKFADIARYNTGDLIATKKLYDYWVNFIKM